MAYSSSLKTPKPVGPRVRAYFASLPPDVRRGLRKIREAIRSAAPTAVENFSYGMPGFRLDGRALVWYAAWKDHYGLYPIGQAVMRAAAAAVGRYETSRGTVRFPQTRPPSAALVKRIVKARIKQVREGGKV